MRFLDPISTPIAEFLIEPGFVIDDGDFPIPGFIDSILATRLPGGWILESRTSGVSPIASMMSARMSMSREVRGEYRSNF